MQKSKPRHSVQGSLQNSHLPTGPVIWPYFFLLIQSAEPWFSRLFKVCILFLSVTALGLSIAAFVNSDGNNADEPEFGSPAEKEFEKIKNLDHVQLGFTTECKLVSLSGCQTATVKF